MNVKTKLSEYVNSCSSLVSVVCYSQCDLAQTTSVLRKSDSPSSIKINKPEILISARDILDTELNSTILRATKSIAYLMCMVLGLVNSLVLGLVNRVQLLL